MPTFHQSHRLRTGRHSTIGCAYHLRFSIASRRPQLKSFRIARAVVLSIAREQEMGRTQNLCFCVMPDHVHWLLVLKRGNLGRSVHNVKCLSNRLADTRIEWQDGFFDHCIRDTNSLRFTARYIVANPLRAELVDNIGLYSHWDAAWLDETFSLHL